MPERSGLPSNGVTLRLSPEVVQHYKSGGPGWQTRIDLDLQRRSEHETKDVAQRHRRRADCDAQKLDQTDAGTSEYS